MSKDNPRIAVLGFAIECNRFAPVTTAADFQQDVDIRGNQIVSEARSGASITMPDLPGFFTEMDRTGQWTPVPLRVSLAQPGGPVEEGFFRSFLSEIEAGLKAAVPLDAVFISAHGAALAEGTDDPDGDLFESRAPSRRSRHSRRRRVRPARQRLAQDDRQSVRVRGLPRESRTPTSTSAASKPPGTCANAWPARAPPSPWSRCRWCRRRSRC